jgi:hypothetical protein
MGQATIKASNQRQTNPLLSPVFTAVITAVINVTINTDIRNGATIGKNRFGNIHTQ